jgi:hypothetical protein
VGRVVLRRACAVLLCSALVAPFSAAADEPAPPEAAHVARTAGLKALADGKHEEAVDHLLTALLDHPHSSLLHEDLLEATAKDLDAHSWWKHRYVALISNAKGSFRPSRRAAAFVSPKDPELTLVALARARAAAEIARQSGLAPRSGRSVVGRVLLRLLDRVTEGAPALRAEHAGTIERSVVKGLPTATEVLQAVEKAGGRVQGPAQAALRLRLGRAVVGLATQARQGAAGAPDGVATALLGLGDRWIRSALDDLASEQAPVLDVARLEALTLEEVAEFNRRHTAIETPARALSPAGGYEVLTPCGHGTLLAAARQVDGIHARLARWFGVDPFQGQRGQVRIFPEYADLEAENAPWWWAQGFQRGSVTTVRFALDTPMGLARILTHELTHRFDAAVYPGLSKWLVEGRAVWTAVAFASLEDEAFREFACDVGRVADAPAHAYANEPGLARLLRDEVADYRDNYTIGHGLWAYLLGWEETEGRPLYRERLAAYLKGFQSRPGDPVAHFASHFCDGGDGRPPSLAAFATRFEEFLRGIQVWPHPEWAEHWFAAGARETTRLPMILDGPTLSRAVASARSRPSARSRCAAPRRCSLRAATAPRPWPCSSGRFATTRSTQRPPRSSATSSTSPGARSWLRPRARSARGATPRTSPTRSRSGSRRSPSRHCARISTRSPRWRALRLATGVRAPRPGSRTNTTRSGRSWARRRSTSRRGRRSGPRACRTSGRPNAWTGTGGSRTGSRATTSGGSRASGT